MSQSTATSERITAIVSTLVAVAILVAGVTAHQSQVTPRDEMTRLESDLRFQLEMAFRHDTNQRAERTDQLEGVIQSWLQSPQSDGDRQLFTSWLRESIVRSIPGSIESWPTPPKFGQPAPSADPPQVLVAATKPAILPAEEKKTALQASELLEEIFPQPAVEDAFFLRAKERSPSPSTEKTRVASRPVSTSQTAASGPLVDSPKIVTASLPKTSRTEEHVHINLAELTARIAWYHDKLDEAETTLLSRNRPDVVHLEDQIQQLDQLANDFQFVKLYYEAISKVERQAVPPPRSLDAALIEVQRQLERHESAQDGDFLGLFDATERERIAQLRQQLNAIRSRVNW